MRRDDIEHALDALASDVDPPQTRADQVVARGRSRVRRRRAAITAVAAVAIAAVVTVGAVARTDKEQSQAARAPLTTANTGGKPSSEIAAPAPKEAWKCRNPLEYTDDGGRTWRTTELAGSRSDGVLCSAVSGGTAWALVADRAGVERLFRVRDGGAHVDAFQLPRGRAEGLTAPLFVDADHGWVRYFDEGSNKVTIYRTADGGATWTRVADRLLQSLSFSSPDVGWSGDGSNILRTANGGTTWQPVHPAAEHLFQTVAIPGGAVAWEGIHIKGSQYHDVFEVTIDDGRTWARRAGPADFERADAEDRFTATDANHWELMSGNALRVTDDAGRTWKSRPDVPGLHSPMYPVTMAFPSAQVGWVTDNNGTILRTTDGGWSWGDVTAGGTPNPPRRTTPATPPPQPVPIPLAFVSPTEGWLCSGPTMLYTTDAGANWKNVNVPSHPPTPPRSQIPVCAAVAGGDAWLVTASADADGLQVIRVSDHGRHVETSAFPPLRSDWTVRDLAFADRDRGWAFASDAAGGASTMFATTDGGRTWKDDAPVRGVTVFATSKDGWAALELLPSNLAHTTDGGRSWGRVDVSNGSEGRLRPVVATGDTVVALAWPVDNSGVRPHFVVTADGGGHWADRPAPRDLATTPIDSIAASATDADHWQVGSGSKLWTTDTGGRTWRQVADFAGFSAITDVHFLTPDVGFVSATGSGGAADGTVVWATTDGGDTWSLVDSHAPPFSARTAPGVNFPGGIIGCPTRPLRPPPAGNPPAGLVAAAKQYVASGPNGWTPDTIQAYRLGANPHGSFGYLFRYQVASCGAATMANGWVVEMHGKELAGSAYLPRAYLAFANYADGWHVFGRYP